MIRIIQKSKSAVVLAALLMMGMTGGKMQSQDLWHFISDMSLTVKNMSVERLPHSPLPFKLKDENEFVNFYQAEDMTLANASRIGDIELRLSKEKEGMAPLLSFSPQSSCISLDAVKKHYPALTLTDYPRGQSENEVTSYTTPSDANGQAITFSFTVKNPDCLSHVVITAEE